MKFCKKCSRVIFLSLILVALGGVEARADDADGKATAKRFWEALSTGNTEKMTKGYAPQVMLKAGSELLKKEWGINEGGERDKDLMVSREALLKGYDALLARIGKEKWTNIFSGVSVEGIAFETAGDDDRPFAGIKRNDLVMKVTLKGEVFIYVLRRDESWRVVIEHADY